MENPIHAHRADQQDPSGTCAIPDPVFGGDQTDELLTKAVIEALAAGMSWAQIGERLGVSSPAACVLGAGDLDWQEAIVAHENARAAAQLPRPERLYGALEH